MGAFLGVSKKLELRNHGVYSHILFYHDLLCHVTSFFAPDPILPFHLLQDGLAVVMVL